MKVNCSLHRKVDFTGRAGPWFDVYHRPSGRKTKIQPLCSLPNRFGSPQGFVSDLFVCLTLLRWLNKQRLAAMSEDSSGERGRMCRRCLCGADVPSPGSTVESREKNIIANINHQNCNIVFVIIFVGGEFNSERIFYNF